MITFENVAYHYQKNEVLSDVNLTLAPGSFHFLTGPSGSGKSTFLKLCSLDLLPTRGRVLLQDHDTGQLTRNEVAIARQHFGIVHQNSIFVDHLNIYDNVLLPVIAAGYNYDADHENIIELLSWIGLGDRLLAMPKELSGGEQTRVALARALIMAPDLILADEPTGNLDWQMAQRVLEMLIELNKAGKTIVIATHDYNIIRAAKGRVDTRILRIHQGSVEIAGASL